MYFLNWSKMPTFTNAIVTTIHRSRIKTYVSRIDEKTSSIQQHYRTRTFEELIITIVIFPKDNDKHTAYFFPYLYDDVNYHISQIASNRGIGAPRYCEE